MEVLPEDPYFEFRPDTLQTVRKAFDLHHPGVMEEMVTSFEDWIEKQNHFIKKDFSKHFLETSIIYAKGSLERAKKNLDKLCAVKTLMPKYFNKHDVRNELNYLQDIVPVILPKQTDDNYRLYVFKVINGEIEPAVFHDYYRYLILECEYMKVHDYTHGICVLLDVRDINMLRYVMSLNVLEWKQLLTLLLNGYGMRIKGIHILSESKAIDSLVAVFRQILSEKLAKRIQVHKTIDTVYNYFPKDILPEEYGGKEKPLLNLHEKFVNALSSKKTIDYFKEICQPATNEALRTSENFNEDILGMPGSFRTLQVD